MRTLRLWLCCALISLTACNKNKPTQPTIDPIKAEQTQLEKLMTDAKAKLESDAPDVAWHLIYLELEAQARLARYQTDHPEESKLGQVTPESAAIRIDMGRYLSEMKKRQMHLAPMPFHLEIKGVTPEGEAINRAALNMFLISSNPTTQPGGMKGNIDILRLYYEGSRALDVTRNKPAPKEIKEIATLGVDVCDAILELYNAKNFTELSSLKQDKKLITGYKRNILTNRKQFAKYAGIKTPPPADPKADPKTDPKNPKDPKGDPKNSKDPKTTKDPKNR